MIDIDLARSLFDEFHAIGFDGLGMTRASYDVGENAAHACLERVAGMLGLEIRRDWALNLFMTLPGRDRSRPAMFVGSHVDTVPVGGNFDGAAGVIAGMAILSGWIKAGFRPLCDVTVMAIRAEESVWFPVSYIGSKAAFGLLTEESLAVTQRVSGRTLREHMRASGGSPEAFRTAQRLDPHQIRCFVELHIEQGPVLIGTGTPLGIVTGICGSLRYRHAIMRGAYAHSGATPRAFRKDAVMATADFMSTLQQKWIEIEAEGEEMTLTFGVCHTDADQADFSTIAGQVDFSVDVRSRDHALLARMDSAIHDARAKVEKTYGVALELGPKTGSEPALMDAALQQGLRESAEALGVSAYSMPSGAGHDSALFAASGVPTAMIFVRNKNGSHNPYEAMDEVDFVAGVKVLSDFLRRQSVEPA